MIDLPLPPLPLADTDDVVKIVIGVAFALFWIIAQVASSTTSKRRKEEDRLRRAGITPLEPTYSGPPAAAQSYDELRRQKQLSPPHPRNQPRPHPRAQPQSDFQKKRKTARQRQPERTTADAALFEEILDPVISAAAANVRKTEIGAPLEMRGGSGAPAAPVARIRALLRPASARDVVIAAELLSPPLALREPRPHA